VTTVDIGAGEEEGELPILAQAAQEDGGGSSSFSDDDDEGIDLGVVLGGLGTLLGGVALGRTWRKRP
jgi:hypothetical protein